MFDTKPNAERLVEAYLDRVGGLETFLPLYRQERGGPERPFFPCYLFARSRSLSGSSILARSTAHQGRRSRTASS